MTVNSMFRDPSLNSLFMGKRKAKAETVSHRPLFDWFKADKKNRARLRAAGYSDGRITNWKVRGGIPRAELAAVAAFMGLTYEQYLQRAGETPPVAMEPAGSYRATVSDDALEIARAFDQLQPQAKAYIREQVFIYTVIDKSFPWLRHGRPMGTTYEEFERWHVQNISAKLDLDAQRDGTKPRQKEKTKS